jgi:hypothetical protein
MWWVRLPYSFLLRDACSDFVRSPPLPLGHWYQIKMHPSRCATYLILPVGSSGCENGNENQSQMVSRSGDRNRAKCGLSWIKRALPHRKAHDA